MGGGCISGIRAGIESPSKQLHDSGLKVQVPRFSFRLTSLVPLLPFLCLRLFSSAFCIPVIYVPVGHNGPRVTVTSTQYITNAAGVQESNFFTPL